MKTKKTTRNKATLIRQYLAQHPEATPAQVAAALADHGITPQYVSFTKSQDKRSKKKAKRPTANGNGHGEVKPPVMPVYASKTAVDIVLDTKTLADKCGGYSELRRLLDVLEGK